MPVIAYDSGGPSEIIINEKTGFLVQNRDIQGMAERVFLLLNNEALRGSIGNLAQKYIAENFTSADYASKLCNALIYD